MGLYRTIQGYRGLYRTIEDYTGLYRTIHEYRGVNSLLDRLIKTGDRHTDTHTEFVES